MGKEYYKEKHWGEIIYQEFSPLNSRVIITQILNIFSYFVLTPGYVTVTVAVLWLIWYRFDYKNINNNKKNRGLAKHLGYKHVWPFLILW